MSPVAPPDHSPEALPPAARRVLITGAFALHLLAAWALLQIEPVRRAAGEVLPIVVDWIVPPPPPPPRPAPPAVLPRPAVVAAPPVPQAPAPVFVGLPPPEAPAPEPAPEVSVAAATPSPPPPPLPPEPRVIAVTAVEYLAPPVLAYPPASRRAQEEGRVEVRVLVDARGAPQQWRVIRSSGHARLDDAALVTVRATRFKPYTENGVPLPFWVVMPLVFEIES